MAVVLSVMAYPIFKLNSVEPEAVVSALESAGFTVTESVSATPHVERVFEVAHGRARAKLSVLAERLSNSRLLCVVVGHRLFWFGDLRLVGRIEALLSAYGVTRPSADELRSSPSST